LKEELFALNVLYFSTSADNCKSTDLVNGNKLCLINGMEFNDAEYDFTLYDGIQTPATFSLRKAAYIFISLKAETFCDFNLWHIDNYKEFYDLTLDNVRATLLNPNSADIYYLSLLRKGEFNSSVQYGSKYKVHEALNVYPSHDWFYNPLTDLPNLPLFRFLRSEHCLDFI
jgi:hypothetical protein